MEALQPGPPQNLFVILRVHPSDFQLPTTTRALGGSHYLDLFTDPFGNRTGGVRAMGRAGLASPILGLTLGLAS
jgi:hypothetical protein